MNSLKVNNEYSNIEFGKIRIFNHDDELYVMSEGVSFAESALIPINVF